MISSTVGVIYYLDVGTFTSANFSTVPQNGQLHMYWSINDTEDGTDTGLSWDTCDEVGAAYLRVVLDGSLKDLPCGGSSKTAMNGLVTVTAGTHTVAAVMLDSSKNAITTQTTASSITVAASQTLDLAANFNWNDFLSPLQENTTGWYYFSTSFDGGRTCSQMAGVVTGEIALLKLNGAQVTPTPYVCDPSNFCYDADGTHLGNCNDSSVTQIMKSTSLKWGSYKLLLQGTLNDSYHTACFSVMDEANNKEIDIVIGAGQVNPVDPLLLKKIYPAASGCP